MLQWGHDKGHGEGGGWCGLICLGEQGRERCLEELMLELGLERDLDVLQRKSLRRVHEVKKSNHSLP